MEILARPFFTRSLRNMKILTLAGVFLMSLPISRADERKPNTLVVFCSDNGPVLDEGYEDGSITELGDHEPADPFTGGQRRLRVPLRELETDPP